MFIIVVTATAVEGGAWTRPRGRSLPKCRGSYTRLTTRSTSGLSDVQFGLKYQLLQEPLVVSPLLSLKVPGLYDDDDAPIMGTGKLDAEGRVLISRSLGGAVYGSVEGKLRANGLPFLEGDSRRVGLAVSLRLTGTLWADAGWEEVLEGENIGEGRGWTIGLHIQ